MASSGKKQEAADQQPSWDEFRKLMTESNCRTNLTVRSFAADFLEGKRRSNENVTMESFIVPSSGVCGKADSRSTTSVPIVGTLISMTSIQQLAGQAPVSYTARPIRRMSMTETLPSHRRRRMSSTDNRGTAGPRRASLNSSSHSASTHTHSASTHSARTAPPPKSRVEPKSRRFRWSRRTSSCDHDDVSTEDLWALWRKAAGRSSRSLASSACSSVVSSESFTGEPNIAACQIGEEEERMGLRVSDEVRQKRARRLSITRCVDVAFQNSGHGEPTRRALSISPVPTPSRPRVNSCDNYTSSPVYGFSKSLREIEFTRSLKGTEDYDDDSVLSGASFAIDDDNSLLDSDCASQTDLEAHLLDDAGQDFRLLS